MSDRLLGLAVQNMGPKMVFLNDGYSLPLTLAGGIGCRPTKNILLSADLRHAPLDSRTTFSLGGEISPLSVLSLRAGYLTSAFRPGSNQYNNFTEKLSRVSGLGLGLGLKISGSSIDYSFTPAGELGYSQIISLALKF